MQVGQLELRADRQLLDHELEVVIAGDRHDFPIRIRRADAERCRNRPTEGTRLTAIDPVAGAKEREGIGRGGLGGGYRTHTKRVSTGRLLLFPLEPVWGDGAGASTSA